MFAIVVNVQLEIKRAVKLWKKDLNLRALFRYQHMTLCVFQLVFGSIVDCSAPSLVVP